MTGRRCCKGGSCPAGISKGLSLSLPPPLSPPPPTPPHPCFSLPGLSGLDWEVEAEDNEIRTPRAGLSLSRASAAKSRPASTKDAEAGSRLPPHAEPAPARSLMDLPTAGEKLEHYTRGRPRPNRRNRQPPSKPNVRPPPFPLCAAAFSILANA